MLKVIQQKVPLLEAKMFNRFGSKDLSASEANSKIASLKLKNARDNTLFILFSGITLALTLLALSMLFSGVSSIALASKALVDFMLEYIPAISFVSASGCVGYLLPKIANVKFASWDAKMVRKHTPVSLVQHEDDLKSHVRVRSQSPTISNKTVRFSETNDLHIVSSSDLVGLGEVGQVQEVTDGAVLRNRVCGL